MIKNNPYLVKNLDRYIKWYEIFLKKEQKEKGFIDYKNPDIANILGMISGYKKKKLYDNPYTSDEMELRCAWVRGYYKIIFIISKKEEIDTRNYNEINF